MNAKAKPIAAILALAGGLVLPMPFAQAANPCKPYAPKTRNPCAAKNPCATKNPCAASDRIDPKLVTRPGDYRPYAGKASDLSNEGKRLWSDASLSTNGLSCNSCHQANGAFQDSFAQPYPHRVQMASDRAGMRTIQLDEMVQICMVAPMANKPLAWDSKALAALAAYAADLQKTFVPARAPAANPCAAAPNPCSARNPCAARNAGAERK